MANDFSGDASCQALWNFDASPGIKVDSSGNNNTLVDTENGQPTLDASWHPQGTHSAHFDYTAWQHYTIPCASLSDNFPFKSTDTTKNMTVVFRFKAGGHDFTDTRCFIAWGSVYARQLLTSGGLYVLINNAGMTENEVGLTIQADHVYDIAIVIDGKTNKSLKVRYRDNGGASTNYTSTFPNEADNNNGTDPFRIAGISTWSGQLDGNLDEFVVFNSIKSDTDIDAIFDQIYGAPTKDYTKGNYADLPTDDAELEDAFSGADITAVSSDDDSTYADQSATGQYAIFEFKENATGKTSVTATWDGKSSLAPSSSTVYLQVYNRSGTPAWETIDSENGVGANTDFTLQATLTDLTNYKEDITGIIAFRVYQLVA